MKQQFAESMNGALFFDLSYALIMFAIYIGAEIKEHGLRARAQAAIAIAVMLLGEAILRGWFWLWRMQTGRGLPTEWMADIPALQLGMSVEMLGVLLLIRVFSPDRWSGRTWLAIGLINATIAAALAIG